MSNTDTTQAEDSKKPPRHLTLILRSTGNHERDKARIKDIFRLLISYHGRDQFSFHVFESGKGYLIDFPQETTNISPELLKRLRDLMGEENWKIKEIAGQVENDEFSDRLVGDSTTDAPAPDKQNKKKG